MVYSPFALFCVVSLGVSRLFKAGLILLGTLAVTDEGHCLLLHVSDPKALSWFQ